MNWDFDLKKFREVICELYHLYPNGSFVKDKLKEAVRTEDGINSLVENRVVRREIVDDKEMFYLDVNGLFLVNSWIMENMTKTLVILSIILTVLGGIQFTLTVMKMMGLF